MLTSPHLCGEVEIAGRIANVTRVADKQLSTPPLNGLILPGVTRRSILELASQWEDLTVKEEVITMDRILELNKKGRVSNQETFYINIRT